MPIAVLSAGLLFLAAVAPFYYIAPAYAHPPGWTAPGCQHACPPRASYGWPAVRFGQGIELLGYSLTPAEIKPGNVLHIKLDWRCLAPMDVSYKLFIHILGYDGERLTQLDTIPYRGRFATVLWQAGQEFLLI